MKYLLLALSILSTTAQAAPWNADCVTFWGKAIPVEERNSENCPTGRSHWDAATTTESGPTRISGYVLEPQQYQRSAVSNNLNPSTPTTVVTNSGTYVIVPRYSGGAIPAAVIRSGK